MKKFLIFVTVLVLFSSVVFASNSVQDISVTQNTASISVDGKQITSDNFNYNGTIYVPLRTISEKLSCDVDWDPDTKTAAITSSTYKEDFFTLYIMADKVQEVSELAQLYLYTKKGTVSNDTVSMVNESLESAKEYIIAEAKNIKSTNDANDVYVSQIGGYMNNVMYNYNSYLENPSNYLEIFGSESDNYNNLSELKEKLKLLIQM